MAYEQTPQPFYPDKTMQGFEQTFAVSNKAFAKQHPEYPLEKFPQEPGEYSRQFIRSIYRFAADPQQLRAASCMDATQREVPLDYQEYYTPPQPGDIHMPEASPRNVSRARDKYNKAGAAVASVLVVSGMFVVSDHLIGPEEGAGQKLAAVSVDDKRRAVHDTLVDNPDALAQLHLCSAELKSARALAAFREKHLPASAVTTTPLSTLLEIGAGIAALNTGYYGITCKVPEGEQAEYIVRVQGEPVTVYPADITLFDATTVCEDLADATALRNLGMQTLGQTPEESAIVQNELVNLRDAEGIICRE